MTEAEQIAWEHVMWAIGDGRSLREIILEVGQPVPRRPYKGGTRTKEIIPTLETAIGAVAHAWIDLQLWRTFADQREAA